MFQKHFYKIHFGCHHWETIFSFNCKGDKEVTNKDAEVSEKVTPCQVSNTLQHVQPLKKYSTNIMIIGSWNIKGSIKEVLKKLPLKDFPKGSSCSFYPTHFFSPRVCVCVCAPVWKAPFPFHGRIEFNLGRPYPTTPLLVKPGLNLPVHPKLFDRLQWQ